jgi:hypothetical protein
MEDRRLLCNRPGTVIKMTGGCFASDGRQAELKLLTGKRL